MRFEVSFSIDIDNINNNNNNNYNDDDEFSLFSMHRENDYNTMLDAANTLDKREENHRISFRSAAAIVLLAVQIRSERGKDQLECE